MVENFLKATCKMQLHLVDFERRGTGTASIVSCANHLVTGNSNPASAEVSRMDNDLMWRQYPDGLIWQGLEVLTRFLTLFLLSLLCQGLTENCLTVYEEKLFLSKFHYP